MLSSTTVVCWQRVIRIASSSRWTSFTSAAEPRSAAKAVFAGGGVGDAAADELLGLLPAHPAVASASKISNAVSILLATWRRAAIFATLKEKASPHLVVHEARENLTRKETGQSLEL